MLMVQPQLTSIEAPANITSLLTVIVKEIPRLPMDEGQSYRASSVVHAPQSSTKGSSLSTEFPISASPMDTFFHLGDNVVHGFRGSLPSQEESRNAYVDEEEMITLPYLSSQGTKSPVDMHVRFLKAPSVLEHKDEAVQDAHDAARIAYNRSPIHQNQFIDSHGGRASQNLPMDEAALSSRASCVVHAPQSFQKVSSLGIEPPVSASPRVTFLLPEDNAVHGSKSFLPNQECSQNPYAYEDQLVTLPYLSDQGVKQPFVVHDPFLVPAVLEPVAETTQEPHEGAPGVDLHQQIIPPYPKFSQVSMPSRLSFSKQIEKRSSLRASLVPQESEADNSPETEKEDDSTSDSSSDVVPEGRLTLESVARPSFSAMLNEQQSIVRPWDIERVKETESRMNNRNDGASNRSFNNPLVTPNEIGSINYENFDTDSSSLETGMVQDDSRDLPEGLETPCFDSIHGMESDSSELNAHQYEEKTRDSGSLSAKASRKSMVQEFIYPNSYPRTSFRVSVSSRDNKEESFPQGAGNQSISSMSSVKQSLEGTSEKDLTSLQTQDFMYSPSLTQNAMDFVPDEKTPIMVENNDPEILEGEFENYSLQHYEQPEFQADINEDPNDESIIHHHDSFQETYDQNDLRTSLQQQPSTLIAGTPGDNEMNDKEYLDHALETAQIDDSEDFPYKDNYGYLEDQTYPQPKDGLHAESFADLKHSFRSLEQGFRRSASFVKVPSGTTDLSYEGFAKIHFIEPTTGIWPLLSKSVDMHDLIRFSKDLISQPLLQRLTASPHKQCAITSFTHLLAYMGNVSTEQDLEYHIQQVLMLGIQFPDLCDEIFCQICKQTKDNPSRWSNSRGWQAMALCVGTFAPSSTFCPSLEAHLKQVAGNFVGRFDGDFIIDQDDPLPNPSKAAEYCLARLQKLLQTGSRCLPPLHAEINAVEKMETMRLKIHLPDDTFKVLDVDPMVTAEEVTAQLVEMTGLSDPEYYGIFEVLCGDVTIEKTLTKNAYIMDIMSEWNKATIPPLEKDLRLIARAKILFERHLLCLPNSGIELYEHEMEEEDPFNMEIDPSKKEMLFKRRIFIEDISSHSPDVQNAVQNFDYVQANTINNVIYDNIYRIRYKH
ncbi:hypothetical protein KP509_04G017100 [Ceratopteris richardii]|uniref:Uncharacterized protein n=1 Tax=Ceratopteris richardii TaxID=49495 RepID=A0A8T2UUX4_CERRI|nr:hypothetical protein KP509_04G017100 [Ceratopteris richardii]